MKIHLPLFVTLTLTMNAVGCSQSGTVQVNEINYSSASSNQLADDDSNWMYWRGPNRNGIAPANQSPVTTWSDSENVIWKSKVAGRGHASPTIFEDKIFLATSDRSANTQSVVCYNRENGELLWSKQVNSGGLRGQIHRNNNHAPSTVSTNGKHLFAVFENNASVQLLCLTLDGEIVWEKNIGEYQPQYPFGFGASPLLLDDKVIVSAESQKGFMAAFNADSGEELWRIERKASSYSSPTIVDMNGKRMLLISGGRKVHAYNPQDGSEIWNADAAWIVSCGTMVWDGNMVFASGGFPAEETLGINAETGEVVWRNGVKCYEQSMLAHNGYIYAISDNGNAYCWRAEDGQEMWKEKWFVRSRRGGGVSSSPILVGDLIFASLESGKTYVIKANPNAYELVAENMLGNSAFATPAFLDSKMYTRVAQDGQEWLYCIGKQ